MKEIKESPAYTKSLTQPLKSQMVHPLVLPPQSLLACFNVVPQKRLKPLQGS